MTRDELNSHLCRIPGVLGANVVFDESGDLDEVHIMADCSRSAREIMLDAKSVLFVCLKSPIDFRKISVARIDIFLMLQVISQRQRQLRRTAFSSHARSVMRKAPQLRDSK